MSPALPDDAGYGCRPDWPQLSNPETHGRLEPDVRFLRKVFNNGDLVMPDGETVRFWGFEDETSGPTLPSPTMRVRRGQLVHVVLRPSTSVHTIHHHGIEPDPRNDGVGHTSFEVGSEYTYQFRPSRAGTFFYHCHVNTALHVQMGMYGALIVDPPEGPGRVFEGGPRYDVERVWATSMVDPRWHEMSHGAGLCGGDAGLNRFDPKYFMINGVAHPQTRTSERVKIDARAGQTILLRLVNAGYFPQRYRFGGLPTEVVASDGVPLVDPFAADSLLLAPAERYDCLIRPTRAGKFTIAVEFEDWIYRDVVGVVETTVTVAEGPPPEPGTPPELDPGPTPLNQGDAPSPSASSLEGASGTEAPGAVTGSSHGPAHPVRRPAKKPKKKKPKKKKARKKAPRKPRRRRGRGRR